MQEPDRETIYVAALLACGLPPKPRDYAHTLYESTRIVDYSKAHRDWMLLAEHIVYTGLWDWMRRKRDIFETQRKWDYEKQLFMNWISERQAQQKLEEYDEQG